MNIFTPPKRASTPFSEFIRNASSREKKRVYEDVLKKASERQRQQIERVRDAKLMQKQAKDEI